jgi:hypothetical protein
LDLLYFRTPNGNFGDDMNQWFWDTALPGWQDWDKDVTLVGIGTILKRGFLPEGRRKLVIGSGVGYGRIPDIRANPAEWDIRCVRGPRAAAALGLPPERGIVDPAVLVADFAEFRGLERSGERLFVPHFATAEKYDWAQICAGTGFTPLSPVGDAREIIRRIARAEAVVAESMHAAIVADAFRTPWQGVAISRAFNDFKWTDWAESVGAELEIIRFFPTLRRLQDLAGRQRPASPQGVAQGTASAGATRSDRIPDWLRPILSHLARKTLAAIGGKPFRLSDAETLQTKKALLKGVLEGVAADYGGKGRSRPA